MTDEPQRPTSNDDREGWKAYWRAQGMPWRTEPEIDEKRQQFLSDRRLVEPNIEMGIDPFKDIEPKLNRADVEWLLATHQSGKLVGPVYWSDEEQPAREGLDLRGADLRGASLKCLPLARMRGGLDYNEREGKLYRTRELAAAHLEEADLSKANLEHANLSRVHFEEAVLRGTNLSGADLFWARLDGVTLTEAQLQGAELQYAFLDPATYLSNVILTADGTCSASLAGVRWRGADLSVVNWAQLSALGEEHVARNPMGRDRKPKDEAFRLRDYQAAVRANRQLAAVLRAQGLNDDADRFAYKAHKLQREVLRRRGRGIAAFGSRILDITSGYGYRPWFSAITYVLVIVGFTGVYFVLRDSVHPALSPLDSLIFSITSFHVRGFSPSEEHVGLSNPLTIFAAVEAIIGLLIEITFIATFTQRFFAR